MAFYLGLEGTRNLNFLVESKRSYISASNSLEGEAVPYYYDWLWQLTLPLRTVPTLEGSGHLLQPVGKVTVI